MQPLDLRAQVCGVPLSHTSEEAPFKQERKEEKINKVRGKKLVRNQYKKKRKEENAFIQKTECVIGSTIESLS